MSDGAFWGLSSIEELSLDRNRVGEVTKGWLYELRTLRSLGLSHNLVEYVAEDGWEFCESLEELDLGSNELQLLDDSTLRDLPALKTLRLNDNKVTLYKVQGFCVFLWVYNNEIWYGALGILSCFFHLGLRNEVYCT